MIQRDDEASIGRTNTREGSMQLDTFLKEIHEERELSNKSGASPDMSQSLDIGGFGQIDENEANTADANIASEEFGSKIQLQDLPSSSNFGSLLGSFRKRMSSRNFSFRHKRSSTNKEMEHAKQGGKRKKFVRFKKFETFFTY